MGDIGFCKCAQPKPPAEANVARPLPNMVLKTVRAWTSKRGVPPPPPPGGGPGLKFEISGSSRLISGVRLDFNGTVTVVAS